MTYTGKSESQCTTLVAWLCIGSLWYVLFTTLAPHWSHFPQYSYGYAVPFLCAYLIWLNIKTKPAVRQPGKADSKYEQLVHPSNLLLLCSAGIAALSYAPVRLLEEANPDWRPLLWIHSLGVIAITLWIIEAGIRAPRERLDHENASDTQRTFPLLSWSGITARDFAFPAFFFLVAVPWPSAIEQPIIDLLTRANTSMTIELLGILGIPAIQHGNLIEVGSGVVGIDEACSGIRSFQAMPMLTLFFGELYRLPLLARIALVLAGFGASFLFNLVRTTILTLVAARKGASAIQSWHDPAGTTILLACFVSVWLLALYLRHRQKNQATDFVPRVPNVLKRLFHSVRARGSPANADRRSGPLPFGATSVLSRQSRLSPLLASSVLAGLVIASEVGVFAWYKVQEKHLPAPVTWSIGLPQDSENLNKALLPEKTLAMLRCDQSWDAQWTDRNGVRWQVIFVLWNPGRAAGYLSLVHNPQVCLPASGFTLRAAEPVEFCELTGGMRFAYRRYLVQKDAQSMHVFFSVWDDRRFAEPFLNCQGGQVWSSRLQAVWKGRGNSGQRLLEVALSGALTAPQAKEQFLAFLRHHLRWTQ